MLRKYVVSKGLPKEKATHALQELELGFLNLSEGYFPQAKANFELALVFDEKCADAYWGLMLCACEIKNEYELYSNPVANKNVTNMTEFKKAFELADEKLKKEYENLLERIYKIHEGENY